MTYSIAEVSERTGLTAHTLRYYERDDLLLAPVARDAGGRRSYGDEDLRWIDMVTCLRATGMPIREIRRYAALVRAGDTSAPERLTLLQDHRTAVLDQLAEITRHLGAIDAKIDLYHQRVAESRAASA